MVHDKSLINHGVLRSFPKIELHRHLEGTFSPNVLYKIALKNGLLKSDDFDKFKKGLHFPADNEPDFLLFLSKFRNDWYRSYDDISNIVFYSVLELINDGIFYLELRFSPEHFASLNNFDRKKTIQYIVDAANKAADRAGFTIKFIITFVRGKQDAPQMMELYDQVLELNSPDILGVDIAGDEINFPLEEFVDFINYVHAFGKHKLTIHAGETGPPEQIWFAVDVLKANRIGHGIAAYHDKDLQQHLKNNDIALEQCIISNHFTGCWVNSHQHPFNYLYRRGIPVTLNSDDPLIQDTDLTEEYVKVLQYFAFSMNDLIDINLQAIKHSFLDQHEKEKMTTHYMTRVVAFRDKFNG